MLHLLGDHIDPTLDAPRQLCVFSHIAEAGSRYQDAPSIIGGKWSFMRRDEERFSADGSKRREVYLFADLSSTAMQGFTEVVGTMRQRRVSLERLAGIARDVASDALVHRRGRRAEER